VLGEFTNLGFDVDVDVSAGDGPVPSFVIDLRLLLRLPAQPGERIDIGIGKFSGRFEVGGRFEAVPGAKSHGRLWVDLSGDVQQGIIPPGIYAGGQFKFRVEVGDREKPLVEMGLGTVASIGGDLIKNLVELEATVNYGYLLIPESLKPGVMLGLGVRACLLSGLFGLSFDVQAMARLERLALDTRSVTIWAAFDAVATVQLAWLVKEERNFRVQFEQKLPLELLAVAAGVNPLLAAASTAL